MSNGIKTPMRMKWK